MPPGSLPAVPALERTVDAVLIGGGGASYPAAVELARAGLKVLLVDDKGLLGGVCLYAGCVPSKAIRDQALKVRDAASLGLRVDPDELWAKIVEFKDRVQAEMFRQLSWLIKQYPDSLTFVKGWATIRGANRVEVSTEEGPLTVNARYIHIGAGSVSAPLKVPGGEGVRTSDWLYEYRRSAASLPDSVVIVGAGYIGVEAAEWMSLLGVKVTLVEMMDRPLPTAPLDISRAALRHLQKLGVDVLLGARVSTIAREGGQVRVRAVREGGEAVELTSDEVIAAVGRRPRLEGYGLESLVAEGLEVRNGAISVDEGMRTSLANVYAAGDVTGGPMLYHAALKESLVAARNMLLGRKAYSMNPRTVPFVIYTYPELAYVGYTEEELKAMGIKYEVVRYSMKANSYSVIKGHTDAWVKFVVEPSSGAILGAQAYSVDAASIVTAAALAMEGGMRSSDLYWLAAPHPSALEALDEAFRSHQGT